MGDVITGRFPAGRPFDGVRLPAQADAAPTSRRDQIAAIVRAETGCAVERADFVAAQVLRLIESAAP